MTTQHLPEAVEADDAPYGQVMFFVFSGAVVIISCLVAVIALADSWWMLAAVFSAHIAATIAVSVVIARALTGRTQLRSRRPAESSASAALAASAVVAH